MSRNRRIILIALAVCVIVSGIWITANSLHRKSIEQQAYNDIKSLTSSQIASAHLTMRVADDPDGRLQTVTLTEAQTAEFLNLLSQASQKDIHCFGKWEESKLYVPYEQVLSFRMEGEESWEWAFQSGGDGTFYLVFSDPEPKTWMSRRCKLESPALSDRMKTYF